MGNHIPLCTGRRNCFCHQRADELSGKNALWEEQSRKEKEQKACQTGKPSSDHDTGCRCHGTGDVWRDPAAHPDHGNSDDEHCRFYSADAKLDSGFFT